MGCLRTSLDLATLHDCSKSVPQLFHHHLRHLVTGSAWDIPVANTVFGYEDVVAETSAITGSR